MLPKDTPFHENAPPDVPGEHRTARELDRPREQGGIPEASPQHRRSLRG
jgi:hypothetical protein